MRERINLIGGSLEVRSRAPHGTLVRATVAGTPLVLVDDDVVGSVLDLL